MIAIAVEAGQALSLVQESDDSAPSSDMDSGRQEPPTDRRGGSVASPGRPPTDQMRPPESRADINQPASRDDQQQAEVPRRRVYEEEEPDGPGSITEPDYEIGMETDGRTGKTDIGQAGL